jgi:hypothetical protein
MTIDRYVNNEDKNLDQMYQPGHATHSTEMHPLLLRDFLILFVVEVVFHIVIYTQYEEL